MESDLRNLSDEILLQQRVLETIGRHSMIRPGDRVGVGVSGGADSVALLHLLAELRTETRDRDFRSAFSSSASWERKRMKTSVSSQELAKIVPRRICKRPRRRGRRGAPKRFESRRCRAAACAINFLRRLRLHKELNRVAVAHTADDQAETVLAHLLRGTGLAGLAGIYPVRACIVRPLIEIGREELRDYLSGLRPILARGCHQSGYFPHARANSPSTSSPAPAGISILPALPALRAWRVSRGKRKCSGGLWKRSGSRH